MEISRDELNTVSMACAMYAEKLRDIIEDEPGYVHPAIVYEVAFQKLDAFLEPFDNFDLNYHIIKAQDMPSLTKQYTLTVTPEQFLEACSGTELHEVVLLLNSKRFADKMYPDQNQPQSLPDADI